MDRTIQEEVCRTVGAEFFAFSDDEKVGISEKAMNGIFPLHGLRHPPDGDTSGWYIWADDYSEEDGFFNALHVKHLRDVCPHVIKFLGLPPGWRFLVDNGYEDVWYDIQLLKA